MHATSSYTLRGGGGGDDGHQQPPIADDVHELSSSRAFFALLMMGIVIFASTIWLLAAAVTNTDSSVINSKSKRPSSVRLIAAESILEGKGRKSVFPLARLEAHPDYAALKDERDRAFCRALVTTTERFRGQIDKVTALCLDRTKKSDSTTRKRSDDLWVEATLRLGAAQILFMDVPYHAAVKESVDVLRSSPKVKINNSKIKFVNAILRKLTREGQDLLKENTHSSDNVAPWLLKQWESDWGVDQAKQISSASMRQASIHLSVKRDYGVSPATDSDDRTRLYDIAARIGGTTAVLPNGSIKVGVDAQGGKVSSWPLYEEGLWWVQDVSASLPAIALASSFSGDDNIKKGGVHAVDMCAAPGGKTAQLLSTGCFKHVTAVETSRKRISRLKKNLERLDLMKSCTVVVADGTKWTPEQPDVQAILLDAPCSATGTGSKRPDVLRRSADLDELLLIQEQLANHCVDNILQPGGILVYATCSTLKCESEDQAAKLLSRPQGAKLETMKFKTGEIPGFDQCIDPNGWLRILPGDLEADEMGSCDGFFVARFVRKE